ncbi:ASCH domain-containing protein [Haloarcula amylovorans]|uniref:ASCH domain-containing protein n=1 Tax=Haloarcula amylovorans TaxID=2562280 RepID=UPI0010767A7F|nr:ASCH domain-containing protein [Halomicroarcula amylolytica]
MRDHFAVVGDCAACDGQMVETTAVKTDDGRSVTLRCQDCDATGELRTDLGDGSLANASYSGLANPEMAAVQWIDCFNCHGSGEVVGCIDDICHGKGRCIHDGNDACPECHGSGRKPRLVESDGGRPQIAFADEHVDAIMDGEKTVTVRYDFDHEFDAGDIAELTTEDGEPFTRSTIQSQFELRADWISFADFAGHQTYKTTGELLDKLSEYYPDADILPGTVLDVVVFEAGEQLTDPPWYCPWCEAVITLDGEVVTSEGGAYWHAYDHRDKGSYAVTVMEAFEVLDTVETEQHLMTPGGDA